MNPSALSGAYVMPYLRCEDFFCSVVIFHGSFMYWVTMFFVARFGVLRENKFERIS